MWLCIGREGAGAASGEESSGSSFYENASSPIKEEPPSYSAAMAQSFESFENPLAGSGSRSFESQDDDRESSRAPQSGTVLYDFTAGGDDELSLKQAKRLKSNTRSMDGSM